MAAMAGGPEADDEKSDDEDIELSWKNLIRFIAVNHPVHPITKEKFSLSARTTVEHYFTKLLDPCLVHVCIGFCKKMAKKYYK